MDSKSLYDAFLAGFNISREGKNGECYYRFRHSETAKDGIELYPFDEYMHMKFEQWQKGNR